MSKTAVVTGITGQDGAYLAAFLLDRGYTVYGTYRRTSSVNFWRIESLGIDQNSNLHLLEYDLTDPGDSFRLIQNCKPDEVYNLAAQSFVEVSFKQPYTTAQITGIGTLNILEAIRALDCSIKFYQASTSELFGEVEEIPQTELTRFHPRSPYGVSKLYAHWTTRNYQEAYGIFATSGILFNHESPLRGKEFVTRKITDGVARIQLGKLDCIQLGNLDAKRDWGYAVDYVEGMYLMLQADAPDSYVLATGRTESVRSFASMAFENIDIEIQWEGEGVSEIGRDQKTGKILVQVDDYFYRPADVGLLIGDSSKAKADLGWEASTSVEELCEMMVEADLNRVDSEG